MIKICILEWQAAQNLSPAGKLMASEVPEKSWIHLTADFITKLPLVAGKDAILVVCDRLSKIMYSVIMILCYYDLSLRVKTKDYFCIE